MKFILPLINLILTSAFSLAVFAQESSPENLIIDDIQCAGNERTNCEIIKNEIYLSPGDHLNEEEIKNAQIRLQLLNLFKSVNLNLIKGNQRGHVILNVEVVEDNPTFSEVSIYTEPTGLSEPYNSLSFKLGHRNLFGRGKILQATILPNDLLRINESPFVGTIEYIDPHLLGHKKYFFNTRIDHFIFKDKNNQDKYVISRSHNQLTANLGLRIFDFSYLTAGAIKNYYSYETREDLNSPFAQQTNTESNTYTLGYGWNSEDDNYFPTEGSIFNLTYYRTDFPYYTENYYTAVEFKKIFQINHKNFFLFGSGYFYYPDNTSNTMQLFTEWQYQLRRNASDKEITDARLLVSPNYYHYTDPSGRIVESKGINVGLLMETKSFGIVRISSLWGL